MDEHTARLIRAIQGRSNPPGQRPGPRLTGRQQEVADLVRAGRTRQEIAEDLGIAVGTVDVHLRTISRRIDDPAGLPAMRRIRKCY